MNNNNINKQAHPRITREFWEALTAIHNHYFHRELHDYHITVGGGRADHILSSLRTLDCLLEIAVEEEWLD